MATFDPGSAVFWKGVRCWQFASFLRATPAGMQTSKAGTSRRRGRISGRSPNFLYNINVQTWVPAIGGDHHSSKALFSGTSAQTTKRIYLDKTLELFIENSGRTSGLGQLGWCDDLSQMRTVSASFTGGAVTTITTTGTWTPATGDLIAVVNPTTGQGWITTVLTYGTGNIQCGAQVYSYERDPADGEPVMKDQNGGVGWYVYKIDYYYDKVEFVTMQDSLPQGRVEDRWSPAVQYQFRSEAGIVYPAAWTPDLS